MRMHPVKIAIEFLEGKTTFVGAPYYGRPTFSSKKEAISVLKKLTGQDFGDDLKKWKKWLKYNRV